MPPLAYFFAGFIVGGLVMGLLVPLLFVMWPGPRVRADDENNPENREGSSGGVVD